MIKTDITIDSYLCWKFETLCFYYNLLTFSRGIVYYSNMDDTYFILLRPMTLTKDDNCPISFHY